MKKRLLSALLALALVFVLLPTTALADTTPVTDENVKINGSAVTVGNDISLGDGNGTYSYDKSTRTLTLNNATITATGSNIGIDFCDTTNYVTYSVILTGENTVTSNNIAIETTPNTNLTFTGGGNLKAITNGYYQAIRVYGTLTIENSTLIAESSAYTATTVIWTLAMTGNNAKLEISNKSAANIVAGTAGPASKNIDWSNYQFTTGSYSGDALTESDPEVCSWGTLNEYLGFPTKKYSQYICIAKRTVPALQRTSDVFIAGEKAVVGVETSIPSANGSGTYFYDQASKTLTLNNVNITSVTNAIQLMADGTYTINLVGTNTISDASNGIFVLDDSSITSLSVTITGVGSLDISAKGLAIGMKKGDLKFENTGAIKLATGNIGLNNNALSVKGNITITDMSKYSVTGTQQTGGKPLGSEVSLTEASQLKGGTTGYRIITITPTPAKDSTISYDGKTLKQGETIKDENDGTATVDRKNNTITLNNFKGDKALVFNAEFTPNFITLIGDSTLSAVETKYQDLTISVSGSGSLTVGSIKVHNQKTSSDDKPNLTINGGAHVTVGTAELTTRAIDIDGDLTVTNGSLTATSTSNNVPTVQVGGNASFTGSTVTITNNSTALHKDAAGSTKGDSVSSALYVKGNINTDNATVTAKVENGGGNAIGALGNITVKGSSNVTAVNKGQKFTTIIAKNVYVSGDSKITANNLNENPVYNGSYLAFPAIEGKIVNQNTDYSLKFEGQHNGTSEPTTLAPGEQATLSYYNVTITRGDKVVRTPSPVVIDGHTLQNDTYYTITNGSTVVANGSESNYNAIYDSANKTLKLNNAKISTTTGTAIKIEEDLTITVTGTNELNGNYNHCIESDNNFKINGTGRLVMTNGSNTAASVIYCGPGKSLIIAAEVIIKNEAQPGKLIHTVKDDAYSFAEGYNVYASKNVSGSPLETYDAANSSTYQYLRITKETLETGGGSTHEHVFSTSWESNADYHWHKCTVQGCTEVSDKEAHVYTNTWWKNSNGNHGRTCDKCRHEGEIHEFIKYYDFADETYHVERCGYLNCTYVGRQETHSYDSFGVCKCGYSPNGLPAPPSLQGVAPTSENGTDGKILNSNIGMEYAQNLNGPWTKWNEHSNITGLSAGTYYVRYTKTDERFPDNQVATVEVPAYTPGGDPTPDVPAAPTGLVGVAPTSENGNGKITGTTAQMEYASSLEGDWTACANDSTDVPAGKYYVRMKKTDNTPAGEAVEVTVPAYSGTGEIVPPTPDNPGTIVIIRPAEEEKPAQQPNPSTGANDLVGLAVAAAVAAALGSAALLRKHD